MKMPFSREQFFSVFETYNSAVYPLQVVFVGLGIFCIFLLLRGSRSFFPGWLLIFFWFWSGISYHLIFFTSINPAAYLFASLFVVQAVLLLLWIIRKKPEFDYKPDSRHLLGIFLMLFGLIFYPFIGFFFESYVSRIISLGLPCPTTIFTFGLLLLTKVKPPLYVLLIPNIWVLVGTMAAVNLEIYQDFSLIIAAGMADYYLFRSRKKFEISNALQK